LSADVYAQPPDDATQKLIEQLIGQWVSRLEGLDSILDVGCAQGQAIPLLKKHCDTVIGVTLGNDAMLASHKGHMVYLADMSFLPFGPEEFKLVWCRHVLEHSPMPLLTLMEWRRVCSQWAIIVVPTIAYHGYGGGQHYYMLQPDQWKTLFKRAGWSVLWEDMSFPVEHRWLLERTDRKKGSPS
jgi:ubiquinone/menaquinone biosynthesis C-methylase UbiE